ncbi:hypothetical protein GCM10008018_66710 [Paenibacillus marchantiophytorum]|uniref:YjzC family protein n=1 Tax=Paenibacillus marchantiophytorum TaxID=1619310 RepID=A0ABQ1FHJ4_9BACL|nr:hypothetical protein [Paenibacillus marchantiophytorum]GGA12281.1 hypothetical protein GCM10008018_66710 [Paenibacillus marchantiophytorum]
MKTATDLHRTNEKVEETGTYICAAGKALQLSHGDVFPYCPVSGNETTWRHANHQHQTGDKVTEAGQYQDADGQTIDLQIGETFPSCPKTGQPTAWHHASK